MSKRIFFIIILLITIPIWFIVFTSPLIEAATHDINFQNFENEILFLTFVIYGGILVSFLSGFSFVLIFLKFDKKDSFHLIIWVITILYITISIFLKNGLSFLLRIFLPKNISRIISNILDFLIESSGFFSIALDEIKRAHRGDPDSKYGIIATSLGICGLALSKFSTYRLIGIIFDVTNFGGLILAAYLVSVGKISRASVDPSLLK